MSGTRARFNSLVRQLGICITIALAVISNVRPACAVVKIFDGFGDADVDNNGIAAEPADTDVSGAGTGTVGPYVALNNGGTPPVFPNNTMVNEVTAATDPTDVGIKWFSISGFSTGTTPTPRVAVHIIDDSVGALPETNPSVGYFSSAANATKYATSIGSGLALAAEAKGRANQAAGFFNQQIQLGTTVGDTVKVSFDFRLWLSAANLNVDTNINHIPAIGEFRFGLYQDTDHQLGQTNTVAGLNNTPAVWGNANGNFRGDNGNVGAQGDHGWYAKVPIDDPDNNSFNKLANGAEARIVEETNDQAAATDKRIMNGASDAVAQPDSVNPQFVNIDVNRVYNLSLTLTRYDDPNTAGNTGDTILATETIIDRATGQQWSYGKFEPVINTTTQVADGISSDKWDYFAMGLAGATDSDDFDWIMDNFKVEVTGSNAGLSGDYNNDGKVNAADYVLWRKSPGTFGGDPAGYNTWRANFGNGSPGSGASLGSSAVPEPSTVWMLLMGAFAWKGSTRRRVA
jgi:hypothetical protein